MPTASDFSFDFEDYGVTVLIPDNDIARLMYYLNCVTKGVGLDVLQDDLIQYKNYFLLSQAQYALVVKTAIELKPEIFIDKVIFRDDKGEVAKDSPNSFICVSAACHVVSLQSDIVIAGRVQNVTKVMFFKSSWLKQFYTDPLERMVSIYTAPRKIPPSVPPRTHNTQQTTFDNPPPPYTETNGKSTHSSPFFYITMSVTELKTFLGERGVEFGDVLDKETLYRRAWDTHCDCMTIVELNTFLSDKNISTVGCRDVNSRRQKAKDAFEAPARPSRPPASSDTSKIRFRKDDAVTLTGLNRAEMNEKTGTVISVDHAEGKALVRVEVLDRTFKLKLENLKMQEEVEEIE